MANEHEHLNDDMNAIPKQFEELTTEEMKQYTIRQLMVAQARDACKHSNGPTGDVSQYGADPSFIYQRLTPAHQCKVDLSIGITIPGRNLKKHFDFNIDKDVVKRALRCCYEKPDLFQHIYEGHHVFMSFDEVQQQRINSVIRILGPRTAYVALRALYLFGPVKVHNHDIIQPHAQSPFDKLDMGKLSQSMSDMGNSMVATSNQFDKTISSFNATVATLLSSPLAANLSSFAASPEIKVTMPSTLSWLEIVISIISTLSVIVLTDRWEVIVAHITGMAAMSGIGTKIVDWFKNHSSDIAQVRTTLSTLEDVDLEVPTTCSESNDSGNESDSIHSNQTEVSMTSTLKNMFRKNIQPQAQSLSYSNLVEPFTKMMVTLGGVFFSTADTRKIPTYAKVGQWASALNQVRTLEGAISASIMAATDLVWSQFTGLPMELRGKEELYGNLVAYLDMAEKVLDPSFLVDIFSQPKKRQAVYSMYKRGLQYREPFKGTEPGRLLHDVLAKLDNLKTALEANQGSSEFRIETVAVLIRGVSNIGKTTMAQKLVSDIYVDSPAEYTLEHPVPAVGGRSHLIYQKAHGSEYWEGYTGQFAVIQDEFLQSRDSQRRQQAINDVFSIVNTAPFSLNMADARAKGKVYFQSKLVILSTNIQDVKSESQGMIHDPSALVRRLHDIEMIVKTPFALSSGALDVQAWEAHCNEHGLSKVKPDYAHFKISKQTYSYDELVRYIQKKMAERRVAFEDIIKKDMSDFDDQLRRKQKEAGVDHGTLDQIAAFLDPVAQSPVDNIADQHKMDADLAYADRFHCLTPEHIEAIFENVDANHAQDWIAKSNDEQRRALYVAVFSNFSRNAALHGAIVRRVVDFEVGRRKITLSQFRQDASYVSGLEPSLALKTKTFFQKVGRAMKEHPYLTILAVLLASSSLIAAVCVGMWTMRKRKRNEPPMELPSQESHQIKPQRPARTSKPRRDIQIINGIAQSGPQIEANIDRNFYQWAQNRLTTHMGRFQALDNNNVPEPTSSVAIFIVAQDCFIMPTHALRKVSKSAKVRITTNLRTMELNRDQLWESRMDNAGYPDVTFFRTPQGRIPIRNIISKFLTETAHATYRTRTGAITVQRDTGLDNYITQVLTLEQAADQLNQPVPVHVKDFGMVHAGYSYIADTVGGDCGSPLIVYNTPDNQGNFAGIHAAGGFGMYGIAAPVSREWLQANYEMSSKELDVPTIQAGDEVPATDAQSMSWGLQVEEVPHGEEVALPPNRPHYKASKLAKHLPWEPSQDNTQCIYTGDKNTLTKALAKFSKVDPWVCQTTLKKMEMNFNVKYIKRSPHPDARVLSREEAINIYDSVNSLKVSTSCGFPFALKGHNKSHYVEYDEIEQTYRYTKNAGTLHKIMDLREEDVAQGRVPEWIFLGYLKPERIPKEKAAQGKARYFASSPLDLLILARQHFGAFLNWIHNTRWETGIMIGIDPPSDFTRLAHMILSQSGWMLATDYSGWDKRLPMDFLHSFFRVADYFYGNTTPMRKAIELAVVQPLYQTGRWRFRTPRSHPSGSPFTSELNSVANIIIINYCLYRVNKAHLNRAFVAVYGDDNIIATKEPLDVAAYEDQMTQLGMILSDAHKSDNPIALETIDTVTFLKRRFRRTDTGFAAPLDVEVIKDMACWVSTRGDEDELMEDTLRSLFDHLTQHDHETAKPIYEAVIRAAWQVAQRFTPTDHMLETMAEASLATKVVASMAVKGWNLKAGFIRQPLNPNDEDLISDRVTLVAIDLGKFLPRAGNHSIWHTGIRDGQRELTFSREGVSWIPSAYEPDWSMDIEFTPKMRKTLGEWIRANYRYHSSVRNCNVFTASITENATFKEMSRRTTQKVHEVLAQSGRTLIPMGSTPIIPTVRDTQPMESVAAMLEQHVVVKRLSWTVSSSKGTTLTSFQVPEEIFTSDMIKRHMYGYQYLTCDVVVTVRVAGSPFYSGKLLGYFMPREKLGLHARYLPTSFTCVDHLTVTPQMTEASLSFPYIHEQNRIAKDGNLAKFSLVVLNRLQARSEYTPPDIVVYAQLANVSITVPSTQPGGQPKEQTVYPKVQSGGDEKSKQGVISGVAEGVENVASKLEGVPFIGDAAKVVQSSASVVKTIAGAMGLSKPTNQQATMPVATRFMTGVGASSGLDNSVILSTNPENAVGIYPSRSGDEFDELNLDYISRQQMFMGQVSWVKADTAAKKLLALPVHPYVRSDENEISPMGYTAAAFQYWRGEIEFEIEVVATPYHGGRLHINFLPYESYASGYVPPTENVPTVVLDLAETNRATFTCPFICPVDWALTGYLFANPPQPTSSEFHTIQGYLNVTVVNTLTAPDSVSETVEVNWYVRGTNMEYAFPTMANISSTFIAQSGRMPEFRHFDPLQTMGERVENVRQLIKIFSEKWHGSFEDGNHIRIFKVHETSQQNSAYDITFMDWFSRMYRFARGSVRHKFIMEAADGYVTATIAHFPTSANVLTQDHIHRPGAPWCATHPKVMPQLEYTLPFFSQYQLDALGRDDQARCAILKYNGFSKETCRATMFEAAGDDFSFHYRLPPPVISTLSSPIDEFIDMLGALSFRSKTYVDSYYKLNFVAVTSHWSDPVLNEQPVKVGMKFYYPNSMQAGIGGFAATGTKKTLATISTSKSNATHDFVVITPYGWIQDKLCHVSMGRYPGVHVPLRLTVLNGTATLSMYTTPQSFDSFSFAKVDRAPALLKRFISKHKGSLSVNYNA